jgi:hypothetical protein
VEEIKQIFTQLYEFLDKLTWKFFYKYIERLKHRITWIYRHGFIKEDDMEWIEPEELTKEEIKKIENEL